MIRWQVYPYILWMEISNCLILFNFLPIFVHSLGVNTSLSIIKDNLNSSSTVLIFESLNLEGWERRGVFLSLLSDPLLWQDYKRVRNISEERAKMLVECFVNDINLHPTVLPYELYVYNRRMVNALRPYLEGWKPGYLLLCNEYEPQFPLSADLKRISTVNRGNLQLFGSVKLINVAFSLFPHEFWQVMDFDQIDKFPHRSILKDYTELLESVNVIFSTFTRLPRNMNIPFEEIFTFSDQVLQDGPFLDFCLNEDWMESWRRVKLLLFLGLPSHSKILPAIWHLKWLICALIRTRAGHSVVSSSAILAEALSFLETFSISEIPAILLGIFLKFFKLIIPERATLNERVRDNLELIDKIFPEGHGIWGDFDDHHKRWFQMLRRFAPIVDLSLTLNYNCFTYEQFVQWWATYDNLLESIWISSINFPTFYVIKPTGELVFIKTLQGIITNLGDIPKLRGSLDEEVLCLAKARLISVSLLKYKELGLDLTLNEISNLYRRQLLPDSSDLGRKLHKVMINWIPKRTLLEWKRQRKRLKRTSLLTIYLVRFAIWTIKNNLLKDTIELLSSTLS